MARGQAQAADTQRQTVNSAAQGQLGQGQNLESQLIPDYTSMLSQGYTPEEKAGMTTAGMGAMQSSYDQAAQQARNNAARTNNPAGLNENQDRLAQEAGVGAGEEAAGLQGKFADARLANQRFGLTGLSDLQKGNQGAGVSLYGMTPGLLGARAAGGGWSQGFKDVGGVITGGLAALNKGGGGGDG